MNVRKFAVGMLIISGSAMPATAQLASLMPPESRSSGQVNVEAALVGLEKLAKTDDADAMTSLALLYFRGYPGCLVDWSQSFPLLQKAADKGQVDALAHLGISYKHGYGTKLDYPKSITWLQRAADAGSHLAMAELGHSKALGMGTPIDFNGGIALLESSARANEKLAHYYLDIIYSRGIGGTVRLDKAARHQAEAEKLYAPCLAEGEANARVQYALMLNDPERTMVELSKAMKLQHRVAFEYTAYYLFATGVYDPTNYDMMMRLLEKDELKDSGMAAALKGQYYDSVALKDRNYELARQCYEKSLELGYPQAAVHLASLYLEGKGVAQDYNRARQLLEQAAKDHNVYAIHYLGILYLYGLGVEQDYGKTSEYLNKAAVLGSGQAMANLAGIEYYGLAGDKNTTRAVQLLQNAVHHHSKSVMIGLADFMTREEGTTRDRSRTLELLQRSYIPLDYRSTFTLTDQQWSRLESSETRYEFLRELADLGHMQALIEMASMYLYGWGDHEQDVNRAISLLKKSAEGGSAEAYHGLALIYAHDTFGKRDAALAEKYRRHAKSLLLRNTFYDESDD